MPRGGAGQLLLSFVLGEARLAPLSLRQWWQVALLLGLFAVALATVPDLAPAWLGENLAASAKALTFEACGAVDLGVLGGWVKGSQKAADHQVEDPRFVTVQSVWAAFAGGNDGEVIANCLVVEVALFIIETVFEQSLGVG